MQKKILLLMFLIFGTLNCFSGEVYFVSSIGNDSNDGLSWLTSKRTIQAAINVASANDSVFVAIGFYENQKVVLKDGVNLYGGFNGTETKLSQRQPLTFGRTQYGEATEIYRTTYTDTIIVQRNAFQINTVVDGFVARKARMALLLRVNGTINNCTFSDNENTWATGRYAAIVVAGGSIRNSLITNNKACLAGGIYIYTATDVIVENCVISGNSVLGDGYADDNPFRSSGIWAHTVTGGNIAINNCKIINNRSTSSINYKEAGGIYCGGNTKIQGCLIANNAVKYTSNTYYKYGGVLVNGTNNEITNCNIVNNYVDAYFYGEPYNIGAGALGFVSSGSVAVVRNCIIWGNKINNSNLQIDITTAGLGYCAVQGGYTGIANINLSPQNTGEDEGVNYPYFVSPSTIIGAGTTQLDIQTIMNADWQLQEMSPCINAGTPSAQLLGLSPFDIYGNQRIMGGRIDIGAAEYVFAPLLIAATAGNNGTISPNGDVLVEYGASQTFTFSANSGYEIDSVYIDDVYNAAAVTAGEYTFPNVTENHKIYVTFAQTESSVNLIEATKITIYPNPTNYELTITNYEGSSVEVCDITGKVVMNCQLSINNSINVSALSQGIYFLKVGNSIKKFVKN